LILFCKEEKLIQEGTDSPPLPTPLSPLYRAMEHFDRNYDGRVSAEEMFTGAIFSKKN
jgi:hypothetical protein